MMSQSFTHVLAVGIAAMLVSACSNNDVLRKADDLIANGRVEDALVQMETTLKSDPRNVLVRSRLFRERDVYVNQLLIQADGARAGGDIAMAETLYRRVEGVEPGNARARDAIRSMDADRRHSQLLEEANEQLRIGDVSGAERRVREVIAESPQRRDAQLVARRIAERQARVDMEAPQLKVALNRRVTLEFRDAPLRSVFDLLARTSGINFIFDRDVRQDLRTTIFVRDVSIDDILKLLLLTNQLDRRVVNDNSVLVYPNTAAKQREYQELVTRVFYLTNVEAKTALNLVRSLVKTRDVFVDEKLNLLVMKDTPHAIRYAEQLLSAQDLAEPEVMLEVEVLEVATNRLQELGVRFPERLTYGVFGDSGTSGISGNPIGGFTPPTVPLTTGRGPFRWGIANPAVVLNLRAIAGETNILANPRIRVRNREKAKVHIGEKVPVFTTTSTANVGISSSVSYLEVGLKLDVEPTVSLDDEVSMKVALEVSNILETITVNNTLAYRLGTRNTATALRLRDGETQVLAGLISDEDRRSANRVPGLGDIPIAGRLFSSNLDQRTKTEIVLLITPRVVRNVARPETLPAEIISGTEASPGALPLRLSQAAPRSLAMASSGPGSAVPSAPPSSITSAPPGTAAVPPPRADGTALLNTPLSLQFAGPAQARAGSDIGVSLGLIADASRDLSSPGSNRVDVVFDPIALQWLGPPLGTPGRVGVELSGASAFEMRFRVIAPPGANATINATVAPSSASQRPTVLAPPSYRLIVIP